MDNLHLVNKLCEEFWIKHGLKMFKGLEDEEEFVKCWKENVLESFSWGFQKCHELNNKKSYKKSKIKHNKVKQFQKIRDIESEL